MRIGLSGVGVSAAMVVAQLLTGGAIVQAQSRPSITGVAGTVGADQQITITGSGFGSGPKVVLFDDFRSVSANQVHPTNAVIGQWNVAKAVGFNDPKLSNGKGIRVIADVSGQLTSTVVFPQAAGEVYVSFVGYVPDGYKFPSAIAEEQLPTVSGLKMAWLMDGSKGHSSGSQSDYVLGGYGGGLYRVSSNDSNGPSQYDTNRNIGWEWDTPVRYGYWLKGNGTEVAGSDGMFQATNGQEQVSRSYKDFKPWFTDAHERHAWDRINFVGYVRNGPGGNPQTQPASSFNDGHNFVMDDIYVATGPNASARVEIGNAPTYLDSTRLTLVTTGTDGDNWSATSITATIRQGTFTEDQLRDGYLYVTDADGMVNLQGYPLSNIPEPSSMWLGGGVMMLLARERGRQIRTTRHRDLLPQPRLRIG